MGWTHYKFCYWILSPLGTNKFLFLVELFREIFFFTDVLFNILQIKSIDILYCNEQLDKTRVVLEKKLDEFAALRCLKKIMV